MIDPEPGDPVQIALEHVTYLRRNGVNPADAAASVGWYPPREPAWDDVVWTFARHLHAIRQGY